MRTIHADRSAEFWPTGWLVWVSVALAAFDLSMLIYVFRLVVVR